MSLSIKPIDPVSRPFFAGEVSGIDITQPLRHHAMAVLGPVDDHRHVARLPGQAGPAAAGHHRRAVLPAHATAAAASSTVRGTTTPIGTWR